MTGTEPQGFFDNCSSRKIQLMQVINWGSSTFQGLYDEINSSSSKLTSKHNRHLHAFHSYQFSKEKPTKIVTPILSTINSHWVLEPHPKAMNGYWGSLIPNLSPSSVLRCSHCIYYRLMLM